MPLNFDILLVIISHIEEQGTLLSCMLCCRYLYYASTESLLLRPVKLPTYRSVISFSRFMHVEFPARFRWLQQLETSVNWFHEPIHEEQRRLGADSLLQVLKHATSLRSLKISAWGELVAMRPDLSDVLSDLTNIKELIISQANSFPFELFSTPRFSLTEVDIHFVLPEVFPDELLSGSSWSLVRLCIRGPSVFQRSRAVYPNLLNLVLRQVALSSISTSALAQSFPNLVSLTIFAAWDDAGDPTWSLIRQSNQEEFTHSTWLNLSQVEGTPLDIYALGIARSVTYLTVIDVKPSTIPLLNEIVASMGPTNLAVDLGLQYFTDTQLESVISMERITELSLRYLSLTLDMSSGPFMTDPRKLMVLSSAFSSLLHSDKYTIGCVVRTPTVFTRHSPGTLDE